MRRFGIIISAAVLFSLLAASQSHAVETYWTGTTGDWHDSLNWDNGVPTISDNAYIDNGGTAQVFVDAESYELYAGRYNSGAVEQTGGIHTVNNYLYLGYESGASGTYNLSAGELCVDYYEFIGFFGTGEFNQSGGTHTVNDHMHLGCYSGSSGIYNLSGMGGLSAYLEYIGYNGTGEFNQDGGTHTVGNSLYLGYSSSSGTYNLNAGELSVNYNEYIGFSGTGVFTQTGGTHTVSGILYLNYHSSFGGTYNLNGGGELSVGDDEYIGRHGTGEFNQSGGIHTVSGELSLGYGSGISGTYNLSGGELSVGSENIGFYGTGEFNQTGGTHMASYLCFGSWLHGSGIYTLSGTAQLSVFREIIGNNYGIGEFNQIGGIHTVSGELSLGYGSGTSGTYNLSVGELSTESETIGYEGTGEFNQTGGINSVRYLSINAASTYTFSSGTLIIKEGGSISGTIDFDHNAGFLSLLGGITDIQDAAFLNAGSASFETAVNSLTVLPAGFDPETGFGSTDLQGIFYTPGTTMIVDEGQSYTGHYDFNDPLEIRGTLIASGGVFGFKDSLTISNGGTLDMSAFALDLDSDYTVTIAATGGNLYTESVFLGNGGEDVFNQHQGVHTVTDTLYIGNGTYNLTGGVLHTGNVTISCLSTGEFNQNGGIHLINGWLYLANNSMGSQGTYNLIDGALSCDGVRVGYVMGRGEFNQSGGTLSVSETLDITSALSTYNLDGGSLEAHDVFLAGKGVLNITNSDAYIEISGSLTLQENAVLMAVPGTTIHMTGSDFENTSTSLNNLGGLENTTFIFEDSSAADTFEIASYDYGLIEENFYGNFGLEGLVLAGSYNGTLQLLDAHVNFTGAGPSTQAEALYVRNLVLGSHATLDLNGYNLYVMDYTTYGGDVLNGEIQAISTTYIPEPSTIFLMIGSASGLAVVAGLARKKCRSIGV